MANTLPIEPSKSTPDLSKLNSMTNRVVTVTRHTSKTAAGFMVLPPYKGASIDQINELHTTLPKTFGPGTYKFEVSDEGGPDKDTWTVKLGADVPEGGSITPSSPMVGSGGILLGAAAAAPVSPLTDVAMATSPFGSMSQDLGGGFHYVPSLGLLITPQKQVIPWQPGNGLPGGLGGPSPNTVSSTPVPASNSMATLPAWLNDSDPRTKALEEQLKAEREARQEEARRRELAEQRAMFERQLEEAKKAQDENNRRFETLLAKLAEKPAQTGPSESELALRRELETMRQDALVRQREEALRNEMRAVQERMESMLREQQSTGKTDPMLLMLTQIMQANQAQNAEIVKAMAQTSTAQAEASERQAHLVAERLGGSVMTPMQIVEMLKMSKDNSANSEFNRSMLDMFQNVFSMAKGIIREQAEAVNGSSAPPWLGVVQQGVDSIGKVAAMYAMSKAQEEQKAASQRQVQSIEAAKMAQIQRQQAIEAQKVQQRQIQAQTRAVVAPPVNAASARDAAAAQVFPQAAPNSASVQRDALAAQLSTTTPAVPVPSAPSVDSSGNVDLSRVPSGELRKLLANVSDSEFFGEAFSQVEALRKADYKTMSEADVAEAVMMVRSYFEQFGIEQKLPCIEVLHAGHVDIVVDRMLPEAPAQYRSNIVLEITNRLKALVEEQESAEDSE